MHFELKNQKRLTDYYRPSPSCLPIGVLAKRLAWKELKGILVLRCEYLNLRTLTLKIQYQSMQAAFDVGADMVELDIKPTKDGQFAVFHD